MKCRPTQSKQTFSHTEWKWPTAGFYQRCLLEGNTKAWAEKPRHLQRGDEQQKKMNAQRTRLQMAADLETWPVFGSAQGPQLKWNLIPNYQWNERSAGNVHACNPGTQETETGRVCECKRQPWTASFWASLSYRKSLGKEAPRGRKTESAHSDMRGSTNFNHRFFF